MDFYSPKLSAFCAARIGSEEHAAPLAHLALLVHTSSLLCEMAHAAGQYTPHERSRVESKLMDFANRVAAGLGVDAETLREAIRHAARDFFDFCSMEDMLDGQRPS